MPMLPEYTLSACRAMRTGHAAACVSAVVGYFYFGYWFSRMRA
jgi:hypothetical protein